MKYYLTYYEAYPIYEHAEGGYYYEGRSAEKWCESENLNEILNSISNIADMFEIELFELETSDIIESLKEWGDVTVGYYRGRYIGENRYLLLEDEEHFQSYEAHWHPYE